MTLIDMMGRFFFEKNRAWLFFCLLAIPFFLMMAILWPRWMLLRTTEQELDAAALVGRAALEKRVEKEQFIARYSASEPYFIDHCLESFLPLQAHLQELKAMKNHPACKNRDTIARRIAFLEGQENRLSFAEENIRSSKRIKETEERLQHPVEIDAQDLNRLLCWIEDVPVSGYTPHPHSPQLLIQDFTLTKKEGAIYVLNLSILQREFSHADEKKN
ncbi:MAG: hypothetical protein HW387_1684 [Parachlamydiales bacterium]|nr:hypothetical protein [Parachlamydiales bacterium]